MAYLHFSVSNDDLDLIYAMIKQLYEPYENDLDEFENKILTLYTELNTTIGETYTMRPMHEYRKEFYNEQVKKGLEIIDKMKKEFLSNMEYLDKLEFDDSLIDQELYDEVYNKSLI